jgi:hypothetical protein
MKLSDIDFPFSPDRTAGVDPASALAPLFLRISRAFRSVRESFVEVEGRAKIIRYNQPPTAPPIAAALPTASVKYLGAMVLLDKNGAANDELHVCINTAGGYAWKLATLT